MSDFINSLLETKFFLQHKELSRKKVLNYYHYLMESQYYSREKLEAIQMDSFNKLWCFALNNIPYYSQLAKTNGLNNASIQTLDDLKKIPVLTKDIVRQNFNALQSNIERSRFIQNSTSGTSGNNFYFFSDKATADWNTALNMRRYNIMGCSTFDKECCIWGAAFDLPKESFNQKLKRAFNLENQITVNGFYLSDDDIIDIYNRIHGKNVILKSYPSILEKMATVLQNNGLIIDTKAVHIAGEKLYPYQRDIIKKVFGTEAFDFYGARDCPNMAQDCSAHDGLHVYMENVIFEVLDENDQPIQDGEGYVAVTGLHNFVMPLIRYKIGDRAKITKGKACLCGRNLQVVDEILGRSFDIIRFPNGNSIEGTFWTLLMRNKPGIREFQIIQEKEDFIKIIYTVENKGISVDNNYFLAVLKEYAGNTCRFDFEQVETIKPTSAGKMKFVISKVNKK